MEFVYKNLKFDTFTLVKLSPYNIRHVIAINKLRDSSIKNLYLWDLKNELEKVKKKNCVDNPYLIKKKNKYVGYFLISNFYGSNQDIVSFACAINKKYRGMRIAPDVTTKVGDYILNNNMASTIELSIDISNRGSRKSAIKSGFRKVNNIENINIYEKKRKE